MGHRHGRDSGADRRARRGHRRGHAVRRRNDIGFGLIVGCFVEAIEANQPSDCGTLLQESTEAQFAELPAQLDRVYEAIDDRAPDARVIATGYMPLLAPGDECLEIAAISAADREWIISLTDELNQQVRDAADRHGGTAVLPEGVENHTGCAEPAERWVDFFGLSTDAYPMHRRRSGRRPWRTRCWRSCSCSQSLRSEV